MISARTSCAGVHALSRLSQFPHVQFLRLAYAFRLVMISARTIPAACIRFSACHNFCRYYFRGKTCAFALIMLFACTISVGVHALFGSSRFPHILVTPAYMHFSARHTFRMYYFCQGTCAFALIPFSARTSHAGVHAISGLSQFPQVEFLPEYMRFLACHNFRTYYFCQCTCGFQLATISACTILTGLHAVSHLSRFSHILGTPGSASTGCNCLNCLNM